MSHKHLLVDLLWHLVVTLRTYWLMIKKNLKRFANIWMFSNAVIAYGQYFRLSRCETQFPMHCGLCFLAHTKWTDLTFLIFFYSPAGYADIIDEVCLLLKKWVVSFQERLEDVKSLCNKLQSRWERSVIYCAYKSVKIRLITRFPSFFCERGARWRYGKRKKAFSFRSR